MDTTKQILTELQEITPFLGRTGLSGTPYVVPAEYFSEFAEILMTRIQVENLEFTEPASEIMEISPLLADLQKKNTYDAPEGYFKGLKINIPASGEISGKLVSIPLVTTANGSRIRHISLAMRLVRFTAAACITGLIGITAYNMVMSHQISDPIKGLTSVSVQDMANYLDADDIHWTPDGNPSSETASMDFSDNDIHELLSSVPDAELEQYFPELPTQKRVVN